MRPLEYIHQDWDRVNRELSVLRAGRQPLKENSAAERDYGLRVPALFRGVLERCARSRNATDIRLLVENAYTTAGRVPEEPWYADLVIQTAVNRIQQDGYDAISHEPDGTPRDLVWGYRWICGKSKVPRLTHRAMNRYAAPKDDPVWRIFGPPPLALGCSCVRETITDFEAKRAGLTRKRPTEPMITEKVVKAAKLKEYSGLIGLSVSAAAAALPDQRSTWVRYFISPRSQPNLYESQTRLVGREVPRADQGPLEEGDAAEREGQLLDALDRLKYEARVFHQAELK